MTRCQIEPKKQRGGSYASGQEGDGLVDSSQWRDIDGLTTDGSLGTDAGGILARTSVNDSINQHLLRIRTNGLIPIGERTWIGFWSVRRWMISKAWATIRRARSFLPLLRPFIMRLIRNGTQLTRLSSWHVVCGPIPVYQSLNNRHLGFLELFLGITASGVREVNGMVDLDVVVEGNVFYFDSEARVSAVHGS